jgi:hypothetical protein
MAVHVPEAQRTSSAWTFGPIFDPYVLTGRDNDVLQMDGLPPGPVVVELNVRGDDCRRAPPPCLRPRPQQREGLTHGFFTDQADPPSPTEPGPRLPARVPDGLRRRVAEERHLPGVQVTA